MKTVKPKNPIVCVCCAYFSSGRMSCFPRPHQKKCKSGYLLMTHSQKMRKRNRLSGAASTNHVRKMRHLFALKRKSLFEVCVSQYGAACMKCKTAHHLTLDHIQPLKLKGGNELMNLQILCKICNQTKNLAVIDYRTVKQKQQMSAFIKQ